MGLFKKEEKEPSALKVEYDRVKKAMSVTEVKDPIYELLLKRSQVLEDLLSKEDARLHPKKDKITKNALLAAGVSVGTFLMAVFFEKQDGTILGRGYSWKLLDKPPSLWRQKEPSDEKKDK